MSIVSLLFVDVASLPAGAMGFVQLIYLTATYAYILMWASGQLIHGSELLLLVPSYADMVGSVVLPILSSLPDCCIILFAGTGPDAQNQLDVGVGALAGGTIMLLTVSWFVSVYEGRVDYDGLGGLNYRGKPKLTPESTNLSDSGVAVGPNIRAGAKIVGCTSGAYLFLQVPGLLYNLESDEAMVKRESLWAFVGMVVCILSFLGYVWYQIKTAGSHAEGSQEDRRNKVITEAIHRGEISLLGVMKSEMGNVIKHHLSEGTPLVMDEEAELLHRLKVVLLPFFQKYDETKTGHLDLVELACVMRDLGENVGHERLVELYDKFDSNDSGLVDFHEFVIGMADYIHQNAGILDSVSEDADGLHRSVPRTRRLSSMMIDEPRFEKPKMERLFTRSFSRLPSVNWDKEEEEEEEDIPDDLLHLNPEKQQQRIKFRAFCKLLSGTVLLMIFSDPVVDSFNEVGVRTGLGAFVVSFFFAPLVSNAPELMAAYQYSVKKTSGSIAISFATLQGSVAMNNTAALGTLMFVIWFNGLQWTYLSETLAVLVVEILTSLVAMKHVHTLREASFILCLYPLSLVLIFGLEGLGYD